MVIEEDAVSGDRKVLSAPPCRIRLYALAVDPAYPVPLTFGVDAAPRLR